MPATLPSDHSIYGEKADIHLFGGNVLAPRMPMTGEGSYAEASEGLGVTGLRFPGGSLTEYTFDWNNPDAARVVDERDGEETDFITTSDFMAHVASTGQSATFVLPTRTQLSEEVDENGNRLPDIDEEGLREFVHDLASGAYGEAEIKGFEIGNEYWGSGEMNAVEYGRLSAEMAKIIDSELDLVAEVYDIDTSGMKVLTQMGHNYNYSRLSDEYEGWDAEDVIDDLRAKYPEADLDYGNIRGSGEPNWTEINNHLVRMAYDQDPEAAEALDGLIAHVYTRGTDQSRHYDLDNIKNTWLEEGYEDLEIHVTEWNLKSTSGLDREEDYGLHQAHEMLNIMEEFMGAGVDQAHVWPLVQNTNNALSNGFEYDESTVPGEMFAMMSENIPGKQIIDFTPGRDTEYDAGTADVHAFAGGGDMVIYVASTSDQAAMNDIDLSNFVAGYESIEATRLGVAEGEAIGSNRSEAHVEELDAAEIFQDGILQADLTEGEILQLVIRGIEPTEEFAPTLAAIDGDEETGPNEEDDETPDEDFPIPILPPEPEEPREEEDPTPDDDGDAFGWEGIAWALGLLPILALIGGAGF